MSYRSKNCAFSLFVYKEDCSHAQHQLRNAIAMDLKKKKNSKKRKTVKINIKLIKNKREKKDKK